MEKGCWVDYPAQIIADNGTGQVEFYVPESMIDYIDLNDTMLYLKVKIVQNDDANLPHNAEIALTNMPISSLFAVVQLSLNSSQIEEATAPIHIVRTLPHYCRMDTRPRRNNYLPGALLRMLQDSLTIEAMLHSLLVKDGLHSRDQRNFVVHCI